LRHEEHLQESIELYGKLLENQPVGEHSADGPLSPSRQPIRSFRQSRGPRTRYFYLLQLFARHPSPHPERYNTLIINLSSSLRTLFVQTGKKRLNDAETFLREAIELLPEQRETIIRERQH
jgi:hypothetical protein